jgi:Ca-activated chloride channel family protein
VNPFIDSSRDHLSTFGLDVDTASYTVARDYIRQGNLPPYEGVRVEEFVNYFKQDYPDPKDATFAVYADGAPSPFHSDGSYLLRVGIQGRHIYDEERKPAHLTFVIDTSGSMNQDGRLEMVKQSLDLMISRLQPNDMVAIVAYNENAWTVLNSTPLTNRQAIRNALYNLRPGGSTNVSAGLQLGYQHAMNMLDGQANNRVILCSDGVANTGDTSIEGILESVNGYVQRGVTLTTVGVGMGNYNDVLLEQLADKGNGQYTYVDTLEQANKFFGEDLTGTLQTIAFDAKVQVDFNPDVVAQYRLLGYENRAIADQNFRNDSVDAGEVGAGHSATAVYAIQLRPGSQGRLATIQLRWKDVESRSVVETNGNFNTWDLTKDFQSASPRYQLTIAAAQFAEILRQSPYANRGTLQDLQRYTSTIARQLPYDQEVVEFDQIVARAAQIGW